MRGGLLSLLLMNALMVAGCSGRRDGPGAGEFARFVDAHFEKYFEWRPSSATSTGFHQYDDRLEDFSGPAIRVRIATLSEELVRLGRIRQQELFGQDQIDYEVLDGQLRAELLDLETLRVLQTNPMPYVSLSGEAVDALMKRDFAPKAVRLRSVIARLRKVPPLLEAMQANVTEPPREFTELALRVASGSVAFFTETVKKWAEDAAGGDASLRREAVEASQSAGEAMRGAAAWLKKDLLSKSQGSYAIGAENFSRKLLYEEMVDIPLKRLLEIGEANLEKDRQAFIETARRIAPGKSPMEAMRMISSDHPAEGQLVESTKRTVDGIRQFLVDRHIVAIPSEVRPIIAETPPYARASGFAMMDTPGPYEPKATEAFYYVTPPEKDWPAARREEHLRLFNRPVMEIITIHEAWPGHYLQFLYARQFPTKTRKLVYCSTNVEGWAHYGEQMMLEEGFGGGEPRTRLAQLSEALLRDCRYLVGIRLHTQGMTVEEGTRFFMEKGYAERAVALEEARRGAYDPTYLYYTLGKLMIYQLREDYRKAKGTAYSLNGFHNDFIRLGGIPIKLVRRILLPQDTASVL